MDNDRIRNPYKPPVNYYKNQMPSSNLMTTMNSRLCLHRTSIIIPNNYVGIKQIRPPGQDVRNSFKILVPPKLSVPIMYTLPVSKKATTCT